MTTITKEMIDAAISVMRKKCVVPSRISLEWMEMHFAEVLAAALRHAETCEPVAISALREAEPYVEICHSLMTHKDTRANVWRVLKQVRAVIAAADGGADG